MPEEIGRKVFRTPKSDRGSSTVGCVVGEQVAHGSAMQKKSRIWAYPHLVDAELSRIPAVKAVANDLIVVGANDDLSIFFASQESGQWNETDSVAVGAVCVSHHPAKLDSLRRMKVD